MRKVTKLSAVIGTLAVLGLAVPATAFEPAEPQIVDAAGDANFINTQGSTNLEPASGPDTRPASEESADVTSVLFRTRYWTVRSYNADGSLQKIDYRPMALEVDITTAGPIKPSRASLIFRITTSIGGCEAWFEAWVRGTQAQATEFERADIRKLTATCPGGATTMVNGFTHLISGNQFSMIFPFEAASFTGPTAGFLKVGTEINPLASFTNNANYPHVRTVLGGSVTAPSVDQMARMTPFTIGSDVPADVICAATPEHAECAAA